MKELDKERGNEREKGRPKTRRNEGNEDTHEIDDDNEVQKDGDPKKV